MATTKSAVVFRTRLKGDWKEIQRKAVVILNGVTFQLYADITNRWTDGSGYYNVDTGRSRAAWMIAVHAATSETLPPGDYNQPPDSGRFVALLEAAPLQAKRVIFNNVSYVVWIELGTETRPGDHTVKLAIQRLISG